MNGNCAIFSEGYERPIFLILFSFALSWLRSASLNIPSDVLQRIANRIEWWIIDVKQYKWLSALRTKINTKCDRLIQYFDGDLWHLLLNMFAPAKSSEVDIVIWCYWWVVTWILTGIRISFCVLQELMPNFWFSCDCMTDLIFVCDIIVQLRTGYLEQGLMVSTF